MNTIIQFRRGTAAEWTAVNPTLAVGEVGYETDTKKIKIGDGSSAWNSLDYSSDTYPKGGGGDRVFLEHSYTVTENYSITPGHHALTVGPLEIEDGVEVTVPSGSNWIIL